jgi:F-type H+-transporting ATPase subunit b
MTINWWTLGLQAVNVLVLVWLLSRVFWRPVAQAIAKRQDKAQSMLDAAKTAQSEADAARTEIATTRNEMAAERETLLAEAATKADTAAKAAMAEAAEKAETLRKTAQQDSEREAHSMRADNEAHSVELAVEIAQKLLARLGKREVHDTFVDLLVEAIDQLDPNDKQMLVDTTEAIDLVAAVELDDAAKTKVIVAVGKALGGEPKLNFVSDPELIAGFEMRTAHFVLRNSWQSDLSTILKDLKNAA